MNFHHELPYSALSPTFNDNQESDDAYLEDGGNSFFSLSPKSSCLLIPRDSSVHKPITVSQFLHKKLRWMTLGAQYDWTKKSYPECNEPSFPHDISNFLQKLFPHTKPQAAIVNLYSPGDTLSLHRDISEDSSNGLISLSIGCDGLFVVGAGLPTNNEEKPICLRLRSGDVLYMTGSSRHCWHGIPKILPKTCPEALREWPASSAKLDDRYHEWHGWLASKRINLNVRQVR